MQIIREDVRHAAKLGDPGRILRNFSRCMLTDIFKPWAVRITRFAKQIKWSGSSERDPGFPAPVPQTIFYLQSA